MKRRLPIILFVILVVLLGLQVGVWLGPGRISINVKDRPLREVIKSFEKQGRIEIRTNQDPEKKITLYLNNAPLPAALERLSLAAQARWKQVYAFAPNSASLQEVVGHWESGKFAGKWYELVLQDFGPGSPDPLGGKWMARTEPEATLDAYLQQASRMTDFGFIAPENWNPRVGSHPPAGAAGRAMKKLAENAGGKSVGFIGLIKREDRAEIDARPGSLSQKQPGSPMPPPGGGPPPGMGPPGGHPPGGSLDPAEIVASLRERLVELPEKEQEFARQKVSEMEEILKRTMNLSKEEQMAALAGAAGPGHGGEEKGEGSKQDMLEARMEAIEAEMTPTQRSDFFRNYVKIKAQVLQNGTPPAPAQ